MQTALHDNDDDEWSCYAMGGYDTEEDSAAAIGEGRVRDLRATLSKVRFLARGGQGCLYEAVYRPGLEPMELQTAVAAPPAAFSADGAATRSSPSVVVKRLFAHVETHDAEGMPRSHLREAALLRAIHHENIVRLHEVIRAPPNDVCLVLERYATDLETVAFHRGVRLRTAQVREVLRGVLRACAFLAQRGVVHRDIKPSNVGIADDGTVKVSDFGSSRILCDGATYSPVGRCTTLVYACPELLLGATQHTPAMDAWGAGVVLAELVLGRHLFHGNSQLETLSKVFKLVGTPNPAEWDGWASLPACKYFEFQPQPSLLATTLQRVPEGLSPAGVDLACRLLDPNPTKRLSAAQALAHPWFDERPQRPEEGSLATLASEKEGKARAPVPTVGTLGGMVSLGALGGDDEDEDEDAPYIL